MTDARWSVIAAHLNAAKLDLGVLRQRDPVPVPGSKETRPGPTLLEAALIAGEHLQPGITGSGLGGGGGTRSDEWGHLPNDPIGDLAVAAVVRPRDPDVLDVNLRRAAALSMQLVTILDLWKRFAHPPGAAELAHSSPARLVVITTSTVTVVGDLGEDRWRRADRARQVHCAITAGAVARSTLHLRQAAYRLTAVPDAPDDKHGCRSCERIKDSRGRPMYSVPETPGSVLCRWCSDFKQADGAWPPEAIVRRHHDGHRIRPADVAAAKEAERAERASRKKGKRR